jgi:thioredoxin reductase
VGNTFDVVIVGGGPVGLYAAYYAGQSSLSVKIIEALPELGGQLWALFPERIISDVAGVPSLKAGDLVSKLKQQALAHKPVVCLRERVKGLERSGDLFEIKTDKGKHHVRAVLLAAGPGAFISPEIYECPAKDQRKRGLFIQPSDVTELADKRVLVCGGKEEAVGWAIDAVTIAESVTVINWFDIFCADEARIDTMFSRHVEVLTPYELIEIHGDQNVTAATVARLDTGEALRLKVDAVLMARGQLTNLVPMREWGLKTERNGVVVDAGMRTSIPGVFAAGDIVYYPGKIKSISAGAAEAATAINSAAAYLNPDAQIKQ